MGSGGGWVWRKLWRFIAMEWMVTLCVSRVRCCARALCHVWLAQALCASCRSCLRECHRPSLSASTLEGEKETRNSTQLLI